MPRGPGKATAKKTPLAAGEQARQRRSRKKVNGPKPGKRSWIFGTKLVFFTARAQEWMDANANGNLGLGVFYTKITNLYLLKYGYHLPDDEDLAEDTPDPTNPDAVIPGSEDLSEEEASARSAISAQIRKRIAAWYCRTYRGLEAREKNVFADILSGIESTGPSYPKRAQPIHFFSRKYYDDKVKARFEARWKVEVQRAEDLEMDEPEAIKIRNEVTKQVYEEQTEEFQAELRLAVEAEHVAAVRAWELTRSQSEAKTPQEMNAALKNAAYYLEPLANAIRDKFMLNCTILVCGPMGDRGGAIEVRSVHAGTTRGLAPRKWYQSDPAGYDATEKSFVRFTEKCFSEEDCLARTVGVPQVDGSIATGVSASAAGSSGGPMNGAGADSTLASAVTQLDAGGASEGVAGGGARGGDAQRGDDGGASGGDAQRGDDGGASGGDASGGASGGDASGGASEGASGGDASGGDAQGGGDGGGSGGDPQGGNDGGAGGADDDPDDDAGVHRAWRQRGEEWTPEVTKAYKAFYAAKDEFGDVWADCVDSWVQLEMASGFNNEGGHLTTTHRPTAVTDFMSGGRRWEKVREIAYVGSKAEEGTYVAKWWAWWGKIVEDGGLAKMHGRTGFMLVVGSLLWWGVKKRGEEWEEAVKAVTVQLEEVVASGKVARKARVVPNGKAQTKRKRADEEECSEDEEGGGRVTRQKRKKAEEGGRRQTRGAAAPAASKNAVASKKGGTAGPLRRRR
ncbi:hypothetical protein C8F04DRAFT_1267041 [Mycena alexandri]|uniref:Uncharacterized protein n=1 Tax=Mycena alexandri TaxID=1745969 RepID=A0AAD6SGC4_9AGAR|nr:hypothetical protein C8F04DRAFT_1267041 [Mycena alexandri]